MYQEDRQLVAGRIMVNGKHVAFYGVYDGHEGVIKCLVSYSEIFMTHFLQDVYEGR